MRRCRSASQLSVHPIACTARMNVFFSRYARLLYIPTSSGEEVERAARQIQSTCMYLCSPTDAGSNIRHDFIKKIFKVFQISTVDKYNEVFYDPTVSATGRS